MASPLAAERWLAIRALREGKTPTFERLAAATGVHPATISQRALRDGWPKQKLPREGSRTAAMRTEALPEDEGVSEQVVDLSPEELRRRLAATLPAQLSKIVALAESGRVDKAHIDTMLATARVLERVGELLGDDAGQGNRSDDELAEFLRQVDDRIVELAHAHAKGLGGTDPQEGMG